MMRMKADVSHVTSVERVAPRPNLLIAMYLSVLELARAYS